MTAVYCQKECDSLRKEFVATAHAMAPDTANTTVLQRQIDSVSIVAQMRGMKAIRFDDGCGNKKRSTMVS
jgi:hypothetical protein